LEFVDKETEEAFIDMVKEFGYIHINSDKPITMESIQVVKDSMIKIRKKMKGN